MPIIAIIYMNNIFANNAPANAAVAGDAAAAACRQSKEET
jgi:hypothetical protein